MSFPITCTACHKTFTISDEIYEKKVAGRVVTIKCKSCSHGIRVDGTKGEARPSSAPAAATSELAAPTEPLWAVDYPDGQDREFTTAEVVAELERGVVNGQTLVWRDGMGEWLELAQVPELATELSTIEARKKAEADAKAKVEAQAKAKADAEAKAKADAEAKAKAPVSPLHKPRAPMPTVTGIGETPTPGAAKARAPLGGATDIKPRAPLGSGPDIKARVPLGSSPELKPRAPLGSAPEITPRAPLGGATDTKPRAPLGSGPDIKPRASLGSSPELKPRAPLGSGPDIKPRAPLGSSPEIKPRDSFESSPEVTPRVPFEVTPRAQQPSSPELLKPRVPQAPPTPLAKPTAPPPVMAAPAPVAPQPAPVAPPAFAASAFLSSPALETVTPPLPASVAKVVSKPPEIPTASAPPAFPMSTSPAPAFGTLPAVVADHASVEWPQSKKKTPLIVLGLVAAAVVIGGVVFALGGKDDVPPPSTPISATPTTPPTATPTAASPATATPTADAAPPSAQSGADTASGSDPIAATPGAGFAELFAAGARKAESKGSTVASAARFDPAVTKAPLAQAATEAQACKQSGGPTGKVTVVVTFEPSGKAAGATITDAPFAGTATASCIAATMKRASIPPFSGLPGTVSKTFSLL